MKITVNPNQEASGDFGYAAAGEYGLRVVKIENCQKAGSEFPYLKATIEFSDPNTESVEKKADGKSLKVGNIFENMTLKPDAQFRLRDFCEALGLTWGDFDTDDCVGMEFQAKVKIRSYNDTLSNEIGKMIPAVR